MEFGLLNHDALWVMDEVQFMDVGLATSAQLQAFREQDREQELASLLHLVDECDASTRVAQERRHRRVSR